MVKKSSKNGEKKDFLDSEKNRINFPKNPMRSYSLSYYSCKKVFEDFRKGSEKNMAEKEEKLIVFDLETTGLNPRWDEILQLTAIDQDGNPLINTLLRPQSVKSWPGAMRVNGITPEMVKDAPAASDIEEIVKKVFTGRDDTMYVAYNGNFDLGFLRHTFGIGDPKHYYDVMYAFAPIYGQWDDYHGNYRWQKLVTCAAYYGYDWGDDTAHDSLADCRATLYCYKQMRAKQEER